MSKAKAKTTAAGGRKSRAPDKRQSARKGARSNEAAGAEPKNEKTKVAEQNSKGNTDEENPSDGAKPDGAGYLVLARKYRPATLSDLIGQDVMVRTLRNAFACGRIAQSYILTGVRGVGKTTTARIIARALNYEPPEGASDAASGPTFDMPALGRHCAAIMASSHPDVVEMDAASNTGVDNVREIIESARYRPLSARYKVFIIDEVHMLSKGAFNALLKTLEEPPPHVKFIFATTEVQKVPVTVLSRCQRFDLRRVAPETLRSHFAEIVRAEGREAEEEALRLIVRAAEGSVRDGLSILDQALATATGTLRADEVRAMLGLADRGRIFDLLEALFRGDAAGALEGLDALHRDGADPARTLRDLAEAVHLITRLQVAGVEAVRDQLAADERARAKGLAERLAVPLLARAWQLLVNGLEEAVRAPDVLAAAEMVLIRLAYMSQLPSPDDLLKRLASRETAPAAPAAPTVPPGPAASATPESVSGSAPPANGDTVAATSRSSEGCDGHPLAAGNNALAEPHDHSAARSTPAPTSLQSLADIATLAGDKRDIRLKIALEEDVRPVAFEPGRIEIALEPTARPELVQELARKLHTWTGERWVVVVASDPGAGGPTLAEERRAREAAEIALVKDHPLLKDVLARFPDATIEEVRPLPDSSQSLGPDERGKDGQGKSEAEAREG